MLKRIACVSMLLSLAGCASFLQKPLYADYAAAPLDAKAMAPYVGLVKALQSADGTFSVPAYCFASPIDPARDVECQGKRNEAAEALIIGSDNLCVDHRRTIYGNDAAFNVTTGTLTSLFAGAASVTHAQDAKSILAALALFSNSERALVNETVYKTMLVTAVDKKIVEAREGRASAFKASLKQPMAAYSMHDALYDVLAYHQACSFMGGLQKALEEGTQGSTAQRILRLKANLAAVGAEMDAVTDQKSEKYLQLVARYKAISETLKTLENS